MAADAAKLLKRLEQLKSQRAVVEDVWRDCYRYTYPLRGVGLEDKSTDGTTLAATAADLQASLYDSTGTDSTRIHASALMSGLTPANSRWFQIDVDGVDDAGRQWLDAAADAIWENIHQSNYDAAAFDCMVDITVTGQFALFCDEADQGGYQFEQWPLATTYFAASEPGGMVDTVLNEFPMTAEQAVRAYGENMVSEKVLKASKDKPDEKFVFIRAIYPREGKNGRMARNMPVASCHFERESKKVVRESGYHEMPLGVPRWSPIPGTAYAFGPVFDALPDLKTLNKVVEFVLKNADLAIAGMWIAEDDGVLNAKSIKIGPRKVIVANSVESMKPLQPAGKFDVARPTHAAGRRPGDDGHRDQRPGRTDPSTTRAGLWPHAGRVPAMAGDALLRPGLPCRRPGGSTARPAGSEFQRQVHQGRRRQSTWRPWIASKTPLRWKPRPPATLGCSTTTTGTRPQGCAPNC